MLPYVITIDQGDSANQSIATAHCYLYRVFIFFLLDFGMARDVYETDYYRKGSKGTKVDIVNIVEVLYTSRVLATLSVR